MSQGYARSGLITPGADTYLALASSGDTTPDYLGGKIVAGTNIAVSILSPGGAETVQIAFTGTLDTTSIADNAITNAKLANMATARIKGRTTAGTGDPEDLTGTQTTALLDAVVGDSGSGGTKGLVPAPAAGDGAAGKYLKADGTWDTPGGLADGDKGDITVSGGGATWTIDNGVVTYAKLQNVSATDRLLGRDTAGAGSIEELTVGGGIEFTGTGGIQTSAFTGDVTKSAGGTALSIANNAVTDAALRQSAGTSVLGRSAGTTGNVADITAAADDRVLSRASGVLAFTQVSNAMLANSSVSVVAGSGLATGGSVALGSSVTLDVGQGAGIRVNANDVAIDYTAAASWTGIHQFTSSSGVSLKPYGVSTGNTTSIRFYELAAGGSNFVGFKAADALAGDVVWTLPIADGSAGYVLKTDGSAALGWVANTLTVTAGSGLTGGGSVALGGSTTVSINTAGVTSAMLRDSDALSVIGRSANSTGAPADIAATAATDYVLRESGGTLGFGTVATAGLADGAVTYAKIQNVSATDKVLGRSTAGAGAVEEIACTSSGRAMIAAASAAAQTALLSAVVGDSGAGGTKGLVPAPAAGDGAAARVLCADGTWRGGSGTTTVDFGSFPGGVVASVAVTGQTAITATSRITVTLWVKNSTDHLAEEHALEPLQLSVGNIIAGTGFTIYVTVQQPTEPVVTTPSGQYLAANGTALAFKLATPGWLNDYGGLPARSYGTWNIVWSWI